MIAPSTTEPVGNEEAAPVYVQLTQVRSTLRRAPAALATPDEQGRYPIVVLIDQGGRFRFEAFALAVLVAVAAVAFDLGTAVTIGGFLLALMLVLAGSARALFLPIPQGTRAVLTRGGRVQAVADAGVRIANPSMLVSHLVALREVPFSAVARAVSTADDIRIDLQILVTFRIDDPVKFVFNTTAPDFDAVCQGASQTAIRLAARRVQSARALDLAATESAELRDRMGEHLAPFGVTVTRVLIVRVDPPLDFFSTHEATRLAIIQVSEQKEHFELDRRVQTDRETLALQQTQQRLQRELEQVELTARVRQREVELEAAREATRLARLEERLAAYPNAARWDWESEKLEVARALAANSRAMVQLGGDSDISNVILRRTLMEAPELDGVDGRVGQPTSQDESKTAETAGGGSGEPSGGAPEGQTRGKAAGGAPEGPTRGESSAPAGSR